MEIFDHHILPTIYAPVFNSLNNIHTHTHYTDGLHTESWCIAGFNIYNEKPQMASGQFLHPHPWY